MASVQLDRCLLQLASAPSDAVAFFSSGRADARTTPGDVRRYANGRLRVVTQAGSVTTLDVTARRITAADLAKIDSWRGKVVLFRDVLGRKLYSVYLQVQVSDYTDRGGYDAAFKLTEVSYSEAT